MKRSNGILVHERGLPVITEDMENMEPKHDDLRERTYLVQCWVHPSSGKDLIDKNRVLEEMRTFLGHVFTDERKLEEGLKQFETEVDGLVLHPFFMKTHCPVTNPEAEFMERIWRNHPEAKFASCQEIPASK